jgi:hypothetical protein
MRKFDLTGRKKMNASVYLEEAARWSRDLTRLKSRGPGDTENAMRAVARECGVDYWLLWKLRYRVSSLRDIGVGVYMALRSAYQAECERQMHRLEIEIELTKKITGPDSDLIREVQTLVGKS